MQYKVIQESDSTSLFESNSQEKESLNKDINSDSENKGLLSEPVPFLQVNITPISSDAFLAQLPTNLYSFIKELVTVVKLHNVKENSIEYAFKFKQLNLEVMLKKVNDLLKIVIKVGDNSLKNELTKDRQELMISILQTKLETDQIDVEFEFDTFSEEKDNQNSEENNKNKSSDDFKNSETFIEEQE